MSAAAARRRKQLAARQAAAQQEGGTGTNGGADLVAAQLAQILSEHAANDAEMSEETAYEALQLAQSVIRKKVKQGSASSFAEACDLAYTTSLALLQKKRISVASQLLTLLIEVLRETHTQETDVWIDRLVELNEAHQTAMEQVTVVTTSGTIPMRPQETIRLQRLQRSWLLSAVQWSSELGTVRYGNNKLQELLGKQCWKITLLNNNSSSNNSSNNSNDPQQQVLENDEEQDEITELQCDAVQHMALAEQPHQIIEWLKTLPPPTDDETKAGHTCPPALRDGLLTRALLLFCAVENLRDANILLHDYLETVEERDTQQLAESYTNKNDGMAPSHAMFGCMLVRICQKDARTGPLFQWLLRSFKRELDGLHKPQAIVSYTTKIGKVYFNIQPPPTMFNMMENMMGMMGGGGGGGMGGGAGGMNPAM